MSDDGHTDRQTDTSDFIFNLSHATL